MITYQSIAQALLALGFEQMGTACAGIWRGYAVSFLTGSRSQTLFQFAVRLDRKNMQPAAAVRESLKKAGFRAGAVNEGSSMAFNVTFNRKTPLEDQLRQFLDAAAAALNENGVAPAATCCLCGGGAPESLCFLNGWQPVHAGCVRQRTEQTREAAEENRQSGSYLLGLLGAVVGAVVGSIPNVLTILLVDRVFAVLFALIPLASMWGYRKLGGKRDRVSIVLVIVLSVLSVLLITTTVTAIEVAREYGVAFGQAFPYTVSALLTAEGFPLLLQDSAIGFLFIAIGIFISWRFLNQTGAGSVKNAEAAETTLRRNPAYMEQGPAEHE